MNNNIVEDLELFNEIIKEFLNEEKTTPASKFISPENIMKEIDLKLDKRPLDNEKYKKLLKQLINSTPKSSSKQFFNQLYGGRHSKAVLGDLLAVILNTSMATFKIAGPQVIVEKTILTKTSFLRSEDFITSNKTYILINYQMDLPPSATIVAPFI